MNCCLLELSRFHLANYLDNSIDSSLHPFLLYDRHRDQYEPYQTPDGFWDLSFPDEKEPKG